jgi:monoamine oxidase
MSDAQVAIIGAGFAGLAAARRISDFGLSVEMFEATGRAGGRAHTLSDATCGVPVELGPEFIHGRPDATLEVMRAAGLDLEELVDHHHMWRGGKLEPIHDMWDRFGRLLEHAKRLGHDRSARTYMEGSRMAPDDAQMFALLVEGFYAAHLDDISIRSVAADAGGGGDTSAAQSRAIGGYGALVDHLVSHVRHNCVPIHHGCVVEAIDWGGDRVRIDYRRGDQRETAMADRVIVTLPLGVLQAGSVAFRPALGGAVEDALGKLGMGQVVKLVLCFAEPVWREHAPSGLEFVHRADAKFPTFWLKGDRQITAWAGGPHAKALAGCHPEELLKHAVTDFTTALGMPYEQLADAIVHRHFHDYATDPFARGAYSYTRVAGGDAADVLARPLGDRLFLAGEATDKEYEGSVAGALASGTRAAEQVLRAMHVIREPIRSAR